MEEKLVRTLDLENGLQLKLFDASRKLIGDRWLVSLIARMEVPVTEALKKNNRQSEGNIDDIKDMLGNSVMYEQKREKMFVDTADKESVFKGLCDMFLDSAVNYLSKEIFPEQYILKTYQKAVKKTAVSNAVRDKG